MPLVPVAEDDAGQQRAVAAYAHVRADVDEAANVVDAKPRSHGAGVYREVEHEAQPLVAEEVPQEQQPVPALVVLHAPKVADVAVDVPVLVAQEPVLEGGLAGKAGLVMMKISQTKYSSCHNKCIHTLNLSIPQISF